MTRWDDVQGWALICDRCGEEVGRLFYDSSMYELCAECWQEENEDEDIEEAQEVDPNYPGHVWPLW